MKRNWTKEDIRDLEAQLAEARAEIEAWKLASGLEDSSGDPDGVTPAMAEAYWTEVEIESTNRKLRLETAEAEIERLKAGVWVRCTSYHDRRADNASYFCGEYTHTFTVQVFAGDDPGDYVWDRRTPNQFRVKVPIEDA